MIVARTCDRCGKIYNNDRINANHYVMCTFGCISPVMIDLCDECAEKAERIVKNFMEANNEKHG